MTCMFIRTLDPITRIMQILYMASTFLTSITKVFSFMVEKKTDSISKGERETNDLLTSIRMVAQRRTLLSAEDGGREAEAPGGEEIV